MNDWVYYFGATTLLASDITGQQPCDAEFAQSHFARGVFA
jgi:hypothetical protein